MKRLLGTVMLSAALPAFAHANDPVPDSACARVFARHVIDHAQAGHLGQHHNPGMYSGLANILDHGHGEHTCP